MRINYFRGLKKIQSYVIGGNETRKFEHRTLSFDTRSIGFFDDESLARLKKNAESLSCSRSEHYSMDVQWIVYRGAIRLTNGRGFNDSLGGSIRFSILATRYEELF